MLTFILSRMIWYFCSCRGPRYLEKRKSRQKDENLLKGQWVEAKERGVPRFHWQDQKTLLSVKREPVHLVVAKELRVVKPWKRHIFNRPNSLHLVIIIGFSEPSKYWILSFSSGPLSSNVPRFSTLHIEGAQLRLFSWKRPNLDQSLFIYDGPWFVLLMGSISFCENNSRLTVLTKINSGAHIMKFSLIRKLFKEVFCFRF